MLVSSRATYSYLTGLPGVELILHIFIAFEKRGHRSGLVKCLVPAFRSLSYVPTGASADGLSGDHADLAFALDEKPGRF
jgi:hypothetical protein